MTQCLHFFCILCLLVNLCWADQLCEASSESACEGPDCPTQGTCYEICGMGFLVISTKTNPKVVWEHAEETFLLTQSHGRTGKFLPCTSGYFLLWLTFSTHAWPFRAPFYSGVSPLPLYLAEVSAVKTFWTFKATVVYYSRFFIIIPLFLGVL